MARYMHVRGTLVVNVVEYPFTPPEKSDEGDEIILDPTGTTDAGETFDPTDTQKDRRIKKTDDWVFNELFRLTNADRAQDIPPKAALTAQQYRNFVKGTL
jgi:hypothetical protein